MYMSLHLSLTQTQLSQADAQSVHRHYEEVLSGVRDKATFASRQLSMASMAADQSIRLVSALMYLYEEYCMVGELQVMG